MNEESLSALLDGECSPAELDAVLRRMERDPSLRARFSRRVLGQEVRRGLRVRSPELDFADRVMAGLPERPDAAAAVPVAGFAWRPVTGLALAAGLGAVAVLALRPANDPLTAAPVATPVAVAPAAVAPDTPAARLGDDDARQLRNYVMAYSQSRAQNGMGGTLGYARYAAYSTDTTGADDRRPDSER